MPYSSVVFNEGEPLDPSKLNALQTSLSETIRSSLVNTTLDDNGAAQTPIIYFNSTDSGKLTKNVAAQKEVNIPTSFDSAKEIFVIASVSQAVGSSIISVYAKKSGDKCIIYVVSDQTRDSVAINYLMVQQKTQG
jgi:hypothetical protein